MERKIVQRFLCPSVGSSGEQDQPARGRSLLGSLAPVLWQRSFSTSTFLPCARPVAWSGRETLKRRGGLTTSPLSGLGHREDTKVTSMSVKLWPVP